MKKQVNEYQLSQMININTTNRKGFQQPETERNKYFLKLGIINSNFIKSKDHNIQHKISLQNKLNIPKDFLNHKSHQQIRKAYLHKLIEIGLLKQNPNHKYQTFTIYDWDDIILCTTYINTFQFLWLPNFAKSLIHQLDLYAAKLLNKSKQYGKVFIISNSIQSWIQSSSQLYLPRIYECIKKKNVEIILARKLFQDKYPNDSLKWKVQAFKMIRNRFDRNLITNLVSICNSQLQISAVNELAKQFRQVIVKTIKFAQNPKPEQLIKQHRLIYKKNEEIYLTTNNLSIQIEKNK